MSLFSCPEVILTLINFNFKDNEKEIDLCGVAAEVGILCCEENVSIRIFPYVTSFDVALISGHHYCTTHDIPWEYNSSAS